jgi:hypothetical protein
VSCSLLRRALTQMPVAFAAAREAAAMDVWPLPSLARALQLPFFGNSVCVRSSKGVLCRVCVPPASVCSTTSL